MRLATLGDIDFAVFICVIHGHPFNKWVAMGKEIRMRLGWVRLYLETKDAGLTCRRCGISRPTGLVAWHSEKLTGPLQRRPYAMQ